MEKEIKIEAFKLLISSNKSSSKETTVLFLPGISGKAFSDRFRPLVNAALSSGLPIVRLSAWEDGEEVGEKTIFYFHEVIKRAVRYLEEEGFKEVIAVGKSFGGGLLLSYHDNRILKKILWAPVMGVADIDTLTSLQNTKLSEVEDFSDIEISKIYINKDTAKLYIIHGTKDEVILLENSRLAVSAAQHGELVVIKGAGHSFKTPEQEAALIAATKQAFKN